MADWTFRIQAGTRGPHGHHAHYGPVDAVFWREVSGAPIMNRVDYETEELTSPGITGSRWRDLGGRFRARIIYGVFPAPGGYDIYDIEHWLLTIKGLICDVTAKAGPSGLILINEKMIVRDVRVIDRIPYYIGYGQPATQGGAVGVELTLQFVKV